MCQAHKHDEMEDEMAGKSFFQTESDVLCIWNGFTAHLSCEVIVRNDEKFKGFQLSKLQLFENG